MLAMFTHELHQMESSASSSSQHVATVSLPSWSSKDKTTEAPNCSGLFSHSTMSLLGSRPRISSTFRETSRTASWSLSPAYLAAHAASSDRLWIRESPCGTGLRLLVSEDY